MLATACLCMALLAATGCGDKPDVYDISIPNLKVMPDESITSMYIRFNAGTVQSVANIPIGWQLKIDNNSTWVSEISARSLSGEATLSPDELKRVVFSVRRNESADFKFDITGVMSLNKTFAARKLSIKIEDFSLAPAARP